MIDMRTIKVGDKVRHQQSGAEGVVTEVHRTPGGYNDSIFIAAPTWLRGVPKGNLNAWDRIEPEPVLDDPESADMVIGRIYALCDELDRTWRTAWSSTGEEVGTDSHPMADRIRAALSGSE